MKIYEIEKYISEDTPGIKYPFTCPWILWIQGKYCNKKDYDLRPVYKFSTIAGFWILMNNIKFRSNHRYIFMREGIMPKWEDPNHTSGGQLYFTTNSKNKIHNIFLECILYIIGETFTNENCDSTEITGLTYINEPNLKQIRIWTKTESLDISKISSGFLNLLEDLDTNFSKHIKFITYKKLRSKTSFGNNSNISMRDFFIKKKDNLKIPISLSERKLVYIPNDG